MIFFLFHLSESGQSGAFVFCYEVLWKRDPPLQVIVVLSHVIINVPLFHLWGAQSSRSLKGQIISKIDLNPIWLDWMLLRHGCGTVDSRVEGSIPDVYQWIPGAAHSSPGC